jgi:hypothetical protein
MLMNLTLCHLHLNLVCHSGVDYQFILLGFCAFHTQRIQDKWKMHGQTYRRWIYTTIQYKKKCYMNIGLLKPGFQVTTFWILKKMFKVSVLSFNTGHCTCEQWLPYSLENSRCHANHLKSILYLLLQVLVIPDFCSINSRSYMSPEIKI